MASKKINEVNNISEPIEIIERLQKIIITLKETQKGFANKIGVAQGFVSDVLRGEKGMSATFYKGLSRLGVSTTWLLTGQGEMFLTPTPEQAMSKELNFIKSMPEIAMAEAQKDLKNQDLASLMKQQKTMEKKFLKSTPELWRAIGESFADQFVLLPQYDLVASAGGGTFLEQDKECVVDWLIFKKDWVRGLTKNIEDLILLTSCGDSMLPNIHNRDLLLVDRSKNRIEKDSIYVMRHGNVLKIKRLQWRVDKSLHIISNPSVAGSNPAGRTSDPKG